MPKSKQIKKRRITKKQASKNLKTLLRTPSVLENAASVVPDVALPSHDAMNLAEMLLNRISKKRGKGEVTQIVVAEMLEGAIRVRRDRAEIDGITKGLNDATAQLERQIIEGFMARVDAWDYWRSLPPIVAVASRDAQVIVKALRKAGFREEPRTEQRTWTVRQGTDGSLVTEYERV
jgi:hypothetical protein